MAKARGRDGVYRPVSIELIVWRETLSCRASSPCASPLA